jgi:hypothetical protein
MLCACFDCFPSWHECFSSVVQLVAVRHNGTSRDSHARTAPFSVRSKRLTLHLDPMTSLPISLGHPPLVFHPPLLQHDNTISFEDFLRGILQLVMDEFGDVPEEDEEDSPAEAATWASTTPSPPQELGASGVAAADGVTPPLTSPRRCGSSRVESSSVGISQKDGSYGRNHHRSASATGMTGQAAGSARGQEAAAGGGGGGGGGGFLATLKNSLRKSIDAASGRFVDAAAVAAAAEAPQRDP